MTSKLKQLLYNYLIDECDTPEPTVEDMKIQYEGGIEHFGSPERCEYFLASWFSDTPLLPVPPHIDIAV